MKILKEIPELVDAGIISHETAERINDYYLQKDNRSPNRLILVFGILGAILVGLGVMLIIAHNWDNLSRLTKTVFAFLPMLIGQALCGYTLMKKADSKVLRESSTAFLFLAVGASISLVSQIYHIPGNLSSFLFIWMLISLPLVYVMNSSVASLLYLSGITWYACEAGYWTHPSIEPYYFWLLMLLVLPHYFLLLRRNPGSNFTAFHNWIVPLSIIITLGTLADSNERFMLVSYMSLFGLFFLIGNLNTFSTLKPANNGFRISGSVGTIALMLFLSFDWFWDSLRKDGFLLSDVLFSPEFITALVITIAAIVLFYRQFRRRLLAEINPIEPVFILFIMAFLIGLFSPFSVILINLIVLLIGVITVRNGAKLNHLGILNFGLLIITALVICRFFDTNLSFVVRGGMFVLVGAGFFVLNIWMLKKRKENE
jgi:uncharacterized membrane protein